MGIGHLCRMRPTLQLSCSGRVVGNQELRRDECDPPKIGLRQNSQYGIKLCNWWGFLQVPKYFVSLSSPVLLNLPLDRACSGNRQQSCEIRFAAKTSTILECPPYSKRKTGHPSNEDKATESVAAFRASAIVGFLGKYYVSRPHLRRNSSASLPDA